MSLRLRHLKRGFTLVELMIVVAIVGILAALAIYGVTKYVKNAKTAEARDSLGRMAKDAVSAYQREGMAASVLSLGGSASINHRLCGSATAVPTGDPPAASKYQSKPSDWASGDKDTGWTCLKFTMNDPQYFQYNYTQTGSTSAAGGTFSTLARGDLDGDGNASTFSISGSIQSDDGKLVAVYAPNIAEESPDE